MGLSYELVGVANLNGDGHLVFEIGMCQLHLGRANREGAPAADDRPPASVPVRA